MNRKVGAVAGFSAAACLAMVVGCSSSNKQVVGRSRLMPSLSPYFVDVPVPQGFKLVDEETSDYMTTGIRYARHTYEGAASPVEVRDFFQEQMPLSRWKWINTQNESGVQTLRFEKDQERCDVTVTQRPRGLVRKSCVKIRISPLGGTPASQIRARP